MSTAVDIGKLEELTVAPLTADRVAAVSVWIDIDAKCASLALALLLLKLVLSCTNNLAPLSFS
ncbi:hypothetical protein BATDEDRAFT_92647 [Batrachochytrium dendrobatidis JAM81]|uniref:Uncharacterized protein n=1 Tax=Batrachochytrium dendrobatidis (strain JAM81 / FGSC 10211) TaxID=684364 RepID=F4PDT9_BATDJ|nr:uncharacterized protein BATDEDRAFT_92647 [Batrachochytrium dendrobatidis JAM81]EGF76453.1 hypothetical protein BATDEDRAFT_92647 [Batrachochytrium dendrobatidis JAM81]|eukprot:XP_006682876.1 hypothetical protein BATDEDRAFT_92647 [Batrachochytrium dendrobatidis JAM81]